MEQQNQPVTVLTNQVSKVVAKNFEALNRSGIQYPKDYVPENTIKSAMFEIAKVVDKDGVSMLDKALTNVKTYNSVINAVNQLLIQGLDAGKKQAYFLPYKDEIALQRSYFGTVTMLKRLDEFKDIVAHEYYEDNIPEFEFDVETMTLSKIKSWNPNPKSKNLAGAFAVIYKKDGTFEVTNMTIDEIHTSWSQSQNYGQTVWLNTPEEIQAAKKAGHKVKEFKKKDGTQGASYKTDEPNAVQTKFGGEMAKRTVINRAAKVYVNSSTAPTQLIQAYNETTENEYKEPKEAEPVVNTRDYGAEIQATSSVQELDTLWSHTIPDDEKMKNLLIYQDKKEELEAQNAIPTND